MTKTDSLTQLGAHVETPATPDAAILETVPFARAKARRRSYASPARNSPRFAR